MKAAYPYSAEFPCRDECRQLAASLGEATCLVAMCWAEMCSASKDD